MFGNSIKVVTDSEEKSPIPTHNREHEKNTEVWVNQSAWRGIDSWEDQPPEEKMDWY